MIDNIMQKSAFYEKRFLSFDIIRGIGIMGMVFLHSAVFHYGEINSIDLNNLEPLLMLFYVLIMWGGMFGVISGSVNTISIINSIEKKDISNKEIFKITIKKLCLAGLLFNFLHFIYYMILGPTNYDLESGTYNHSYGFIPGSIKTNSWYLIQTDRWFEQSSLAMIGWILIFLGVFLFLLLRNEGYKQKNRNQWILYIFGSLLIIFSFFRIPIHKLVTSKIDNKEFFIAWILSLFGYEPFPLLPFLGYGLIGAAYAFTLSTKSKRNLRKYYFQGILWFIIFILCFILPDQFYERFGYLDDILIMYLLVLFQIGFFLIGLNIFVTVFDRDKFNNAYSQEKIIKRTKIIRSFSSCSLSIFLLERITSNLWAMLLNQLNSNWNTTIFGCILFGIGMVIFWCIISLIWRKFDYRFTIEKIWKKISRIRINELD